MSAHGQTPHVHTCVSHGLHQHTLQRIKSGRALPTASSQLICFLLTFPGKQALLPSTLKLSHCLAAPAPQARHRLPIRAAVPNLWGVISLGVKQLLLRVAYQTS